MKKILYVFLLGAIALSGCVKDPAPDSYFKPELELNVDNITSSSAKISCKPSNNNIATMTLKISKGSNLIAEKSLRRETSGTWVTDVSNLEPGENYFFQVIADGGKSSVLSSVVQARTLDIFIVENNNITLGYAGDYFEISVESSLGDGIEADFNGAEWIKEVNTRSAASYKKQFKLDYNSDLADRTGTITLSSSDRSFTQTVTVTQKGGPISFEDPNFKAYLTSHFDKDGDREIVLDEAKEIKSIEVATDDIKSLAGIEHFTEIEGISAFGDKQRGLLTDLDLRNNSKLKWISVNYNSLTSIDVSNCPELERLYCWDNELTNLDVTGNARLRDLRCAINDFSERGIDLSANVELQYLYIDQTKLSHIDISNNVELLEIGVYSNDLAELDLSNNSKLYHIHASNNKLTHLDLTGIDKLRSIYLNTNLIESLDVTGCPELEELELGANRISSIDISRNNKLRSISVGTNPISELNTANNVELEYLIFDNTRITEFNVSHLKKLKKLWAHNTHITQLDISGNPDLEELNVSWTDLSSIDLTNNPKLKKLYAESGRHFLVYLNESSDIETLVTNDNTEIVSENNEIEIPDQNFKSYLLQRFDRNGDGKLSYGEAKDVEDIGVNTDNIESVSGIEYFPKLKWLTVNGTENNVGKLTEIDVTRNTQLISINIENNHIQSIDLSQNTCLDSFIGHWNDLRSLDFSHCPRLKYIWSGGNHNLESVNLDGCHEIEYIHFWGASISNIDLSDLPVLREVLVNGRNLQSIDVRNSINLEILEASGCSLSEIDLSHNVNLKSVNLNDNALERVDVSSLSMLVTLNLGDNNTLSEVIGYENKSSLEFFDISDSKVDHVDLEHLTNLKHYGGNNIPVPQMPDFSHCPNLEEIHISYNGGARYLDDPYYFRQFKNLKGLNIWGYQGSEIDFSEHEMLQSLWIGGMPNVKELDFSASPNLRYVNIGGDTSLETVFIHPSLSESDIQIDGYSDNVRFIHK